MDPASLIDTLVATDVLVVTADDALHRTASFEDRELALRDATNEQTESLNDAVEEALVRHDLLATYLAVTDLADLDDADALQAVLLLARLHRTEAPDDGVPEAFTPVDGDLLDLVLLLTERAIVYVWRADCPPCDVMREEFDDIFPEPPADTSLFAVFGPDWAVHLQEQYNVVGGPTTLFMLGTRVDVRLQGGQHRAAIDNEIEKFCEVTL
jgi:hypothetical protein